MKNEEEGNGECGICNEEYGISGVCGGGSVHAHVGLRVCVHVRVRCVICDVCVAYRYAIWYTILVLLNQYPISTVRYR